MAQVITTINERLIPYPLDLEIHSKTGFPTVYSKQYEDGGRYIVGRLYNDGEPFKVLPTDTIYFCGTKINQKGILASTNDISDYLFGIDVDGNIIYQIRPNDTSTETGYEVEFRIVDKDNFTKATPKFRINIEKSALQDSTPVVIDSGSVISSLVKVTDNANKAYNDYRDATLENTDVAIINLRQDMLYIEPIEDMNVIPIDAGLFDGYDSSYFAKTSQVNEKINQLNADLKDIENGGIDTRARENIGNLSDLTTTEKTNLVRAINELQGEIDNVDVGGSGGTSIDDSNISNLTTYSSNKISSDMNKLRADLGDKASKSDLTTINDAKADKSDLVVERKRIDAIVTSAGDYYIKCASTDTGAKQVVDDTTTPTATQIKLASVTPHINTYTPVVGDYVRKVTDTINSELIDARIDNEGKTHGCVGDAIRGSISTIININPSANMYDRSSTTENAYIDDNGNINIMDKTNGYYNTGYRIAKIYVKGLQSVYVNNNRCYRLENESGTMVSKGGHSVTDSNGELVITIPSTASYLVITVNEVDDGKFVVSTDKTNFTPTISIVNDILNKPHKKYISDIRIGFLGDSITWGYNDNVGEQVQRPFPSIIKDEYGFRECLNYGISGSTVGGDGATSQSGGTIGNYPMCTRILSMPSRLDVVFIFTSPNDYKSNNKVPLGTKTDTTVMTYYGSLKVLLDNAINRYPGKKIIIATPLRCGSLLESDLRIYADAVKEMCELYGVDCYDLYTYGEFYPFNNAFSEKYSVSKMHPNQDWYYVLARKIGDYIYNHIN